MTKIINVAGIDVSNGFLKDPGPNSMLIQIIDPVNGYDPVPVHKFKEIHQFFFLDIDNDDIEKFGISDEHAITDQQAFDLTELLKYALDGDMNVVVHCTAGVSRSGAVVEVAEMLGFEHCTKFRAPNLRVKHKMMKTLGLMYDLDEKSVLDEVTPWGN